MKLKGVVMFEAFALIELLLIARRLCECVGAMYPICAMSLSLCQGGIDVSRMTTEGTLRIVLTLVNNLKVIMIFINENHARRIILLGSISSETFVAFVGLNLLLLLFYYDDLNKPAYV
ncbi:CLUMA_CG004494, isoform A [Clunio marinus]|uniref:CLUMA_CG004494, isoform A n=1 Tax=Clunio marinus TaxID=568069 RepID=A0A1J1HTV3_9DIPT|nr:CLUMA_CG004494, isoform A [Clunio marinus]